MKVEPMALGRDTAPHPVFRQVVAAVRQKKLLRPDDRVLVAVSGGPDSVCLVLVLHELRQRGDGVIRPLLGVTREQVLDYLASRGVAYRTDSSNATRVYRRNRIRHEIVPLLRTFNPRIVQGLARAAEILAADAALLDDLERERWKAVVKDVASGRVVLQGERLAQEPLGLQRRVFPPARRVGSRAARGPDLRPVWGVGRR